MNTQLVESIVQMIRSLSPTERQLLESKLFFEDSEPTTLEIMRLAELGGSFDFLKDEPDIYTLEDGEPIS
jgi:DNA-directed RNA polymerase sigma subunit (sigma70/sigma32)